MILKNELEAQGANLFRWRSFVPLMILPLVAIAIFNSSDFPDGHANKMGQVYDLICILISFLGLAIRGYTVATAAPRTSGRNTREQRADSVNTTGVYSIVRHPLYLANFVTFLGMLLFLKVWWLVVIASLMYVMYYERIILAEEKYLLDKFGSAYSDWADRTPVMIPNFRSWVKPEYSFSLKTLLRREYNGFYLIVVCFYVLEWFDRLLFYAHAPGPFTIGQAPGLYWTSFFVTGTMIFFVLRSLKKYTKILNDAK